MTLKTFTQITNKHIYLQRKKALMFEKYEAKLSI